MMALFKGPGHGSESSERLKFLKNFANLVDHRLKIHLKSCSVDSTGSSLVVLQTS